MMWRRWAGVLRSAVCDGGRRRSACGWWRGSKGPPVGGPVVCMSRAARVTPTSSRQAIGMLWAAPAHSGTLRVGGFQGAKGVRSCLQTRPACCAVGQCATRVPVGPKDAEWKKRARRAAGLQPPRSKAPPPSTHGDCVRCTDPDARPFATPGAPSGTVRLSPSLTPLVGPRPSPHGPW